MVETSPSALDHAKTFAALSQSSTNTGWHLYRRVSDNRSFFVSTIMGDYLRCMVCDSCGASFIVNKDPHCSAPYNHYWCPSCHDYSSIRANDAFLKAMLSEEKFNEVVQIRKLQEENNTLQPFKRFFDVPCEICKKPVTEWDKGTLEAGICGFGWAHKQCLNSSSGQMFMMAKVVRDLYPHLRPGAHG